MLYLKICALQHFTRICTRKTFESLGSHRRRSQKEELREKYETGNSCTNLECRSHKNKATHNIATVSYTHLQVCAT